MIWLPLIAAAAIAVACALLAVERELQRHRRVRRQIRLIERWGR